MADTPADPTGTTDSAAAARQHRRDLLSCGEVDLDNVAASVHVDNPLENLPAGGR